MTETQKHSELRVSAAGDFIPPADGLSVERLRTIVQDSHLSFLVGAGTSASFFEQLGPVETVLTELGSSTDEARLARASVQGFFFEKVLLPNVLLMNGDASAQPLIKSYGRFVAVLNRILLKRRSTILSKQVNLFTTNVDMAFEVALELLEIDVNDGFAGKINPRLDLGEFSTLRFRQGTRFEYRSEIPVMNLFKIHGSAAWKQKADEIYFDHRLETIQSIVEKYEAAKDDLLPIASKDDIVTADLLTVASGRAPTAAVGEFVKAYELLSIVNPEKTKFATTVLNKTYYELLRRLANELEKENSALFVHGFSFRDEHLLDLVLRASATNPTLQVIIFCHSRKAHAEVRALFPDEKVKNGNILLVQPSKPEEEEAERLLTLDVLVEDYLSPVLIEPIPRADHVIELKLNEASGEGHA
jgi:hypothetical protein